MSAGDDRPAEPPPERVRSTPGPPMPIGGDADEQVVEPGGGPVPVRDLMKKMTPEHDPPPEAEVDPRWDGVERGFRRDDVAWVVRSAGAGAYGTGRLGTARLVAVHFYRSDEPDTPVREALLPAGVLPRLDSDELAELFDRATPIPRER